MIKTKKAAIGAAMTWVVATIIILFVIIIFVYTSVALFGGGEIKDILFVKEGQISSGADSEQMLLALLQKEVDDKEVREIIVEGGELNKDELHQIFNNIPNCLNEKQDKDDSWVLNYNGIGKKFDVKAIGKSGGADFLVQIDEVFSVVYLGDKEIKLFEYCEEVYKLNN